MTYHNDAGQTDGGAAVIARYKDAFNATLEYPSQEASAMENDYDRTKPVNLMYACDNYVWSTRGH